MKCRTVQLYRGIYQVGGWTLAKEIDFLGSYLFYNAIT